MARSHHDCPTRSACQGVEGSNHTGVKSKLIFHRDLTITRGAKSPIEAWAAAFHATFNKLHGQMVGR
jgi:hypothetical protein